MKKSIIAIGVVAVLGIGYVGIAWHTGNVIEENIQTKVAEITQQINQQQQEYQVTIDYSDYQKSIFATKMHLVIKATDKNNAVLTVFNDDITIHHGPFPLAALSHGQFAPQMAWVDYAMSQEASPELWQLAGNKAFITGTISVSYQENTSLTLNTSAVDSEQANNSSLKFGEIQLDKFKLSPSELTLSSNKDLTNMTANFQLDKASAQMDGESITLNKLTASTTRNSGKTNFNYTVAVNDIVYISKDDASLSINFQNYQTTGELQIGKSHNLKNTLDKIVVSSIDNTMYSLSLNNLVSTEKRVLNSDNSNVDGESAMTIESVLLGKQNLGNIEMDMSYKGFPFFDFFAGPNFYGFLKTANQKNISVSLDKFNLNNEAGTISSTIQFDIDSSLLNEEEEPVFEKVNKLKFILDAPLNVVTHLVAQAMNETETTVTQQQIDKVSAQTKQMIAYFSSYPTIFVFDKKGNAGIYSDLEYSKDSENVKLNGNSIPKNEFIEEYVE